MDNLPDLVQLIVFFVMFAAIGAVHAAPQLLAGWAEGRREKVELDLIRQSEIVRKVAIAEAAIEARTRGEKFVPPDDYAR
jgi:hypothetical protein